jgi:hypothetical protein
MKIAVPGWTRLLPSLAKNSFRSSCKEPFDALFVTSQIHRRWDGLIAQYYSLWCVVDVGAAPRPEAGPVDSVITAQTFPFLIKTATHNFLILNSYLQSTHHHPAIADIDRARD